MKAKLRGKEIDCRIVKETDDKLYIEYSKLCHYNNSTCLMNDHPEEIIKQSVREWVKREELEVIE